MRHNSLDPSQRRHVRRRPQPPWRSRPEGKVIVVLIVNGRARQAARIERLVDLVVWCVFQHVEDALEPFLEPVKPGVVERIEKPVADRCRNYTAVEVGGGQVDAEAGVRFDYHNFLNRHLPLDRLVLVADSAVLDEAGRRVYLELPELP